MELIIVSLINVAAAGVALGFAYLAHRRRPRVVGSAPTVHAADDDWGAIAVCGTLGPVSAVEAVVTCAPCLRRIILRERAAIERLTAAAVPRPRRLYTVGQDARSDGGPNVE